MNAFIHRRLQAATAEGLAPGLTALYGYLSLRGVRWRQAHRVASSRYCARLIVTDDLIPFDMGGTSTDISLVVGGRAQLAADRGVAGHRVGAPSLHMRHRGAGR